MFATALVWSSACATEGRISVIHRSPAASSGATPGASDLADPATPGAGNGGYDVAHYDLKLDVDAARSGLSGIATIKATATRDLSAFDLDLAGMDVSDVTVDHTAARFTRRGDELVITPRRPLRSGRGFETTVTYSGRPASVDDPTAEMRLGWLTTASGSYVASEPNGAKSFFPCNDHPSDKATYRFAITAAGGDTAVANGTLVGTSVAGDRKTWTYDNTSPMATYLVQIAVGAYDVVTAAGPHGLPLRHVVLRSVGSEVRSQLDVTAAQISFFETQFGPFPFETYGLLVTDSPPSFALETQTLTLMPAGWFTGTGSTTEASTVLAHELAHQWFGDSVSLSVWSDIWLNEGFATYAEWLWDEHAGGRSLATAVEDSYASAAELRRKFGPVAEPKPADLFSENVYDGGALVLAALRRTVGDTNFTTILHSWAADHAGRSGTTAEFERLATKVSGMDLRTFFDSWLRSTKLPPLPA